MSNILSETYARFEDRFRGSRESILDRLRVYEPLLTLVRGDNAAPTAIDYGCGRGEWLEVLRQAGWDGCGVDTNVAMLSLASRHGLRAERADALAHLGRAATGSVDLISAFHLVEHLPIETLLLFIREALRVLRPDGVLLLETPNPENLLVGTCNFYLDPTHQRPLPPVLLAFLVEDGGAAITRIVRLNGESGSLGREGSIEAAIRPMFATALDYAVIASRSSGPALVHGIERFVADASQPAPVDLAKVAEVDAAVRHRDDATATTNAAAIAATHQALGQQANHLQATTDRMTHEMAEIGARMTDDIASERAARAQALAEALRTLETALAPLVLVPKLAEDFEHVKAGLARIAEQVGSRERELEAQLRSTQGALQNHAQQIAEHRQREAALNEYVEALLASRSWRVTRPLRALTNLRARLGKALPAAESMPRSAARSLPRKKNEAPDPRSLLMMDADPEAVATWRELLKSLRTRDQVHASVD